MTLPPSDPQHALHVILAAHGSSFHTGGADVAALCQQHLVASKLPFASVRCAFWKGGELALADAIDACPPGRVLIIPLLMNDGYFARQQFPRALGVEPHDRWQQRGARHVRLASPAGMHPAFSALLHETTDAIFRDYPSAALILAAHGTERDPRSSERIYALAEELRPKAIAQQRDLHIAFLDEAPLLETILPTITAPHGVIVPWFAADGAHAGEDIPALVREHATQPITVLPSIGPLLFPAICAQLVRDALAWTTDPL